MPERLKTSVADGDGFGVDRVDRGDVRRAKLYFLRDLKGKAARMKEQKRTVTA